MTARVLFAGDVETTSVKFPLSLQPTRSTDLGYGDYADLARVEGVPGNLWITEIVNGPVQQDGSRLNSPQLMGGAFMHEVRARHFTAGTGPLPGQDESWYVGRWKNTSSFGSDGAAHMDIVIQQSLLSIVVKHYSVSIRTNDTGGNWRKVAPARDSGPWAGNDFELEIKCTGDGVEFRVRRTGWNTGFTPAGYDLDVWFYGKEWERDYSLAEAVVPDGPPPAFVGTTSAEGKGPFVSPALDAPNRAQTALIGGGAVNYINSGGLTLLKWTRRFMVVGLGANHLVPNGFFEIPVPVGGVSVPVYCKTGSTSTDTVAGGVWLTDWDALYYEIPWGGSATGPEANFRIVNLNTANGRFQVPSHWILIAIKCGDNPAFQYVQLGNGNIIDWSHPLPLNTGGGWAILGSGWTEPGWRSTSTGHIMLEGMTSSAAVRSPGSVIGTLPLHARPGSSRYWGVAVNNGFARVYISASSGQITLDTTLSLNSWLSLDGISFPRAG